MDVPVCGSLTYLRGSLAAPRLFIVVNLLIAACLADDPEERMAAAWIPNPVYAFTIPGILKNRYREKGYEEIK